MPPPPCSPSTSPTAPARSNPASSSPAEQCLGPRQDTGGEPPDGRLLFHRVDDGAEDFEGRLVTVDAAGGDEQLTTRRSYTSVGHYDASPAEAGDVVAVVTLDDGADGLAVVGESGALRRQAVTSGPKLVCPAWDARGERLLVNDDRDTGGLLWSTSPGRRTSSGWTSPSVPPAAPTS